ENVLVCAGSPPAGLEQSGRLIYRQPTLGAEAAERLAVVVAETAPDLAFVHTGLDRTVAERLLALLPTINFVHIYNLFCASGGLYYERSDSICPLRGVPNWRCLASAYLEQCNTRRPNKLLRMYRQAKESAAWTRRADAILCASEYVAARCAENGFSRERVHVLPYPVVISHEGLPNRTPRDP